jgi:transcriptional regulator with XRE-family HTH domain
MSIILDDPGPLVAKRVRAERDRRGWSLADLAERSGVSKAMLSKIEREEVSPTAVVLARVATAFGLTLAQLLTPETDAPSRLMRAQAQPTWTDPEAGYTRRQVFIDTSTGLELAEVTLPAGATVSMPASVYARIRQVAWMLSGKLTVTEGRERHDLKTGDRLEFGPPSDVTFRNESGAACRYLIALLRV